MYFKQIVLGFLLIAPIVLIVSFVVTYLYGALVHGIGMLEWESSIRLAVVFGIALPVIRKLDKRKAL